jgi:hypothetical protein
MAHCGASGKISLLYDEAILYGVISWPILDLVSRLVVTLGSQYRGFSRFAAPGPP